MNYKMVRQIYKNSCFRSLSGLYAIFSMDGNIYNPPEILVGKAINEEGFLLQEYIDRNSNGNVKL